MDVSLPLTEGATRSSADAAVSKVEIPQYRRRAIFAVSAAAALPMAALAWLVAPALEDRFAGAGNVPMAKALIASLTVGGRVWPVLIPLIVALAAEEMIPRAALPENRDFATLLESDAGQAFLDGAWGWYGLFVVFALFNTVLGEPSTSSRPRSPSQTGPTRL